MFTATRRVRTSNLSRAWRQASRSRLYASEHGPGAHTRGSDLPWIIGSVAVTVPAATWLWNQGSTQKPVVHLPTTSGHDDEDGEAEHGEKDQKEEGPGEGQEQPQTDEQKGATDTDGDQDQKSQPREEIKTKGEGPDASQTPGSPEEKEPKPKPGQEVKDKKGPGEEQAGTRPRGETKAEKDSKSDQSNANNPYLNEATKTTKGEGGPKETAKTHGTVNK